MAKRKKEIQAVSFVVRPKQVMYPANWAHSNAIDDPWSNLEGVVTSTCIRLRKTDAGCRHGTADTGASPRSREPQGGLTHVEVRAKLHVGLPHPE